MILISGYRISFIDSDSIFNLNRNWEMNEKWLNELIAPNIGKLKLFFIKFSRIFFFFLHSKKYAKSQTQISVADWRTVFFDRTVSMNKKFGIKIAVWCEIWNFVLFFYFCAIILSAQNKCTFKLIDLPNPHLKFHGIGCDLCLANNWIRTHFRTFFYVFRVTIAIIGQWIISDIHQPSLCTFTVINIEFPSLKLSFFKIFQSNHFSTYLTPLIKTNKTEL